MQYQLITAGKAGPGPEPVLALLAERVNEAIKNGWSPVGGVAFAPIADVAPGSAPERTIPFLYASQAMVRG